MTAICLRKEPDGTVCGGRVTWRADANDWGKCGDCRGTGYLAERECPRCRAAGWMLRPR
jgi:DnaJ-class molecular chaperone